MMVSRTGDPMHLPMSPRRHPKCVTGLLVASTLEILPNIFQKHPDLGQSCLIQGSLFCPCTKIVRRHKPGCTSGEACASLDANFFQDHRQRAEGSKGRLEKVEANQECQKKEPRRNKPAKSETDDHHKPGKSHNEAINVHL